MARGWDSSAEPKVVATRAVYSVAVEGVHRTAMPDECGRGGHPVSLSLFGLGPVRGGRPRGLGGSSCAHPVVAPKVRAMVASSGVSADEPPTWMV